MATPEFFQLREAGKRGAVRAHSTSDFPWDPRALFRGEVRIDDPVEYVVDEGSRFLDLVGTTYGTLKLVSAAFVAMVEEEGLTGFVAWPVSFTDKKGRRVDGYHGLGITGRCGPVGRTGARRLLVQGGDPPIHEWRGLYFDLNEWDGSDLFVSADTDHVLASERLARAMEERKLSGFRIDPQADVRRGFRD